MEETKPQKVRAFCLLAIRHRFRNSLASSRVQVEASQTIQICENNLHCGLLFHVYNVRLPLPLPYVHLNTLLKHVTLSYYLIFSPHIPYHHRSTQCGLISYYPSWTPPSRMSSPTPSTRHYILDLFQPRLLSAIPHSASSMTSSTYYCSTFPPWSFPYP